MINKYLGLTIVLVLTSVMTISRIVGGNQFVRSLFRSRSIFNSDIINSKSKRGFCTSGLAALERDMAQYSVVHSKYDIVTDEFISEYGIRQVLYKHKQSGAQVLSVIAPKDDNKVFGITFRTPPDDSTGIPHILEHSVLCGSENYPSKEPFAELLKGSLNTFLNAFTYPDRTCYPVASQNLKDFYNLINVYLDAVLRPKAITDPLVRQRESLNMLRIV